MYFDTRAFGNYYNVNYVADNVIIILRYLSSFHELNLPDLRFDGIQKHLETFRLGL